MTGPPPGRLHGAGPIRLRDLLAAELTTIRTLPATWFALAGTLAANTLLGMLATTETVRVAGRQGAVPVGQLGSLMIAPVYVFVAVAVFAAGGGFRGGQTSTSLLCVPQRDRLFAARLMVLSGVGAVAAAGTVLPGHLARHAAAVVDGTVGIGAAAADLVALVTAYLLLSFLGYGLAVVTRTVVTPLAVLFIAAVLAAPTLRGSFPELVRYLPHDAALSLTGLADDPAALSRAGGLVTLAAWACMSVGTAWRLFAGRDS